MRKTPMPRRSRPIARGERIKAKPRTKAERERIYGSREFADWLHDQPCAVSGVRGDIQQAHAVNGGTGRKADWQFTFPIAPELHHDLHQQGRRTFEAAWRVDLFDLCRLTQQRWRAECARRASLTRKER